MDHQSSTITDEKQLPWHHSRCGLLRREKYSKKYEILSSYVIRHLVQTKAVNQESRYYGGIAIGFVMCPKLLLSQIRTCERCGLETVKVDVVIRTAESRRYHIYVVAVSLSMYNTQYFQRNIMLQCSILSSTLSIKMLLLHIV